MFFIVIMIIQLTPLSGFSVTNYVKYYAYLYYLLSLNYIFFQQLWYYFPNYVYPNPERLEKTHDFRQSVELFSHETVNALPKVVGFSRHTEIELFI